MQNEANVKRFDIIRLGGISMNVIAAVLFGIYGIIGGVSTVVCTVSIPGIIIWKFYRKAVHHKALTD